MDPDSLAAAMRPIRLPAAYAEFGVADALATFALGLLAGVVVLVLVRPLLARRRSVVAETKAAVASLAGRPAEERVFGLARLLRTLAPDAPRPAGLDDALYRGEPAVDVAALERAVLAAARRRP